MNQHTLDRIIESHRQLLLAAGNDPLRIIAANKMFFAQKLGYLPFTAPLSEGYLFNRHTRGSYHPWSASVMGEVFGDSGLKELISITDYLNSSPLIDSFLEGTVKGIRKATERKAIELKRQQELNKGKQQGLPPDVATLLNKGH